MITTIERSRQQGCVAALTRHFTKEELRNELAGINQQLLMAKELLEMKKRMEACLVEESSAPIRSGV